MVLGQALELCLGPHADDTLQTLLGALDAEVALTVPALFLGRAQGHGHSPGCRIGAAVVTA
jgi:hypothetical protein